MVWMFRFRKGREVLLCLGEQSQIEMELGGFEYFSCSLHAELSENAYSANLPCPVDPCKVDLSQLIAESKAIDRAD
jgi:hypothetical protein